MPLRPTVFDIELWATLAESSISHWALLFYNSCSPGHVDQWVRVLYLHAKFVGLVSGQGTYQRQPVNT